MSISIEALKEAIQIKEQIAELESRLNKILSGEESPKTPARRGRKNTAPEKVQEGAATPVKRRKGKRTMSPEGRARISAAAKARWAAQRKS